jgi:hypothetical protein
MARVHLEWVELSIGPLYDAGASNVVKGVFGAAQTLSVGASATAAGARPTAPAGARYARLSAVDGNVIAAWGADPTAAQANGMLVMQGAVELVPVAEGDLLSLVELAAA